MLFLIKSRNILFLLLTFLFLSCITNNTILFVIPQEEQKEKPLLNVDFAKPEISIVKDLITLHLPNIIEKNNLLEIEESSLPISKIDEAQSVVADVKLVAKSETATTHIDSVSNIEETLESENDSVLKTEEEKVLKLEEESEISESQNNITSKDDLPYDTNEASKENIAEVKMEDDLALKNPISEDEKSNDIIYYGVINDDIEITLAKSGWIYAKSSEPALKFVSRYLVDNLSIFKFKSDVEGVFVADFLLQDLFNGINQNTQVKFVIKSANIQNVSVKNTSDIQDEILIYDDYSLADELYSEKKFNEALDEYLKRYKNGNPLVNMRIANLSFQKGLEDEAFNFWHKNLVSKDNSFFTPSLMAAIESALKNKSIEKIKKLFPFYLISDDELFDQYFNDFENFFFSENNAEFSLHLMNEFINRNSEKALSAEVLFSMAQLYEKEGKLRDERKAIEYYELILSLYPASIYWEKAGKRIKYLKHNFIYIR